MSNYTKIQNWASLTGTSISGTPFDTEFASLAAVSSTKSDKIVPAATNNLASLSGTGNLQDSGLLTSAVQDAMSFHYATGDIKIHAVDTEPTGWLYADGGSHSTSTYANLFAAIGYTYGGSGANFNVPDFRGRSPAGLDNLGGSSANANTDGDADIMGGEDGAQTVTLTSTSMPYHKHSGSSSTTGAHTHDIGYTYDVYSGGAKSNYEINTAPSGNHFETSSEGNHSHTITVGYTGSGGSHENVSPTTFTNYLIKT